LIVLGLDISTANIGICTVDSESLELLSAHGLPMSKIKGLYLKAAAFEEKLREVIKELAAQNSCPDAIVIEQSLQAFRRNMSSAGTIAKLNRFNGMASYIARTVVDVPVQMGNVVSVRKQLGLKLDRKSPLGTKDQVLNWVSRQNPMLNFDWPTKILKGGPSKGQMRIEDYCYDIADAFVMAYWGAQFLKKEQLDPYNV
jgi:hypothetical protein